LRIAVTQQQSIQHASNTRNVRIRRVILRTIRSALLLPAD